MGLRVDILRSDYDSAINAFHGFKRLTVTNVPGPFDPTPDAPAALLVHRDGLGSVLTPAVAPGAGLLGPMSGGTFAYSSDSRWGASVGGYFALPIHDRYETPAMYAALSS